MINSIADQINEDDIVVSESTKTFTEAVNTSTSTNSQPTPTITKMSVYEV